VTSEGTEDLRYIHALLMDPDFGLINNLMPQVPKKFPKLLKASKEDLDTPTPSAALAGFLKLRNSKSKIWSNMEYVQWYQESLSQLQSMSFPAHGLSKSRDIQMKDCENINTVIHRL
jgi:hypothetical protein